MPFFRLSDVPISPAAAVLRPPPHTTTTTATSLCPEHRDKNTPGLRRMNRTESSDLPPDAHTHIAAVRRAACRVKNAFFSSLDPIFHTCPRTHSLTRTHARTHSHTRPPGKQTQPVHTSYSRRRLRGAAASLSPAVRAEASSSGDEARLSRRKSERSVFMAAAGRDVCVAPSTQLPLGRVFPPFYYHPHYFPRRWTSPPPSPSPPSASPLSPPAVPRAHHPLASHAV